MLKKGYLVRARTFQSERLIGSIISAVKRFAAWGLDELTIINIDSDDQFHTVRHDVNHSPTYDYLSSLSEISKHCNFPISYGGGIRLIEQCHNLFENYIDKVVLNSAVFEGGNLLSEIASTYGGQNTSIIIDYKYVNTQPYIFIHSGKTNTNIILKEGIKELNQVDCGDIFIRNIETDGLGKGADVELITECVNSSCHPIIAYGGLGTLTNFLELSKIPNISGVAASNFFHFTENSYKKTKEYLKYNGISIR